MRRNGASVENNLRIQLVAFNDDLYRAWQDYFAEAEDVMVSRGDILSFKADAIVSPANSFGYMDGGLDAKYSAFFGWQLEARLRSVLEEYHYGELPVGQAVIVETEHQDIPYLISAPTMRVPMKVANTPNAFLAFKAVLQAVQLFNRSEQRKITSILCPGLGTGEGKMPPERCAYQMFKAYEICLRGEVETRGGLAQAVRNHQDLLM